MRIVNLKWDKMIYYAEKEYDMKPLKTKVSITLDTEIIEAIKYLAEQDDRSFSQYINLVLKKHLEKCDVPD